MVYVMMVLPVLTPATTPDASATVAAAVLLLLHVPPAVALVSEIVDPGQTVDNPVISAGKASTLITVVL
jgi:hypothetical protein